MGRGGNWSERAERKLVGQLWCAEGRYEQRTQFDDAVCTMIEGGRESWHWAGAGHEPSFR